MGKPANKMAGFGGETGAGNDKLERSKEGWKNKQKTRLRFVGMDEDEHFATKNHEPHLFFAWACYIIEFTKASPLL